MITVLALLARAPPEADATQKPFPANLLAISRDAAFVLLELGAEGGGGRGGGCMEFKVLGLGVHGI